MPPLLTEADLDESSAYHEAGHAWVAYWHFSRKGWCDGIGIELVNGLGYTRARGLRVPDLSCWTNHAAFSAAGCVSAGLWGERKGFFSWHEWETRSRRDLKEEYASLVKRPDEGEFDGDFAGWIRHGRAYGLPVTPDVYWRGWENAAQLVRFRWPTIEVLARALLSNERLSESEVLTLCEATE